MAFLKGGRDNKSIFETTRISYTPSSYFQPTPRATFFGRAAPRGRK